MEFPKIVHLIYIPWNKHQKLKDNYMDFDTSFYEQFKRKLGSKWKIIMWTRDKIEKFMDANYPNEWKYVKRKSSRPVMLVDYLRWKLVHHFGGIYWQYGSKLLSSIKRFIPSRQEGVLLFTETKINIFYRYFTSTYGIRRGIPEEELRVATQVFSAYRNNKFIQKVIDRIVSNIGKYKIWEDYDILFVSGNAMISTVYDECKKFGLTDKYKVDLCPLNASRSRISFSGTGSWRTDRWYVRYMV